MKNDFDDNFFADGTWFDGQQSMTPDLGSMKTTGTNKLLVVLFVIDCSRSMEGERIMAVNAALAEVKFMLQDFKNDNGLDLKIAIMSFASSVKWELPLTDIDEVSLENLGTRPGLTEYGNAFHELNKVLRKDKFMKHTGKIAPPAIVFLTDGGPTDRYDSDLEELLKNEWFANASRGVILVGDAIDDDDAKNAVRRFVEDPEHEIVDADESDKIIRKIKTATMHAVAEEPREEDNTKEKLNKTGEGIPQGEDTEGPWGGGMGNPFGKDIGKIFKDIEDDIDIF